jgi:Icc-related predicted phosphoesterase/uncharacterized protein YprB with RNaseH-like and TPR domain
MAMSDTDTETDIRRLEGDPTGLNTLLLSDCHDHSPSAVLRKIRRYPDPIDAILYAGDGLHKFNQGNINYLEALAEEAEFGLFIVAGNDDPPNKQLFIDGENVYDVHERPVIIGDFAIVGQEGIENRKDRVAAGMITYEKDQIERHLRRVLESLQNKKVILLSHMPPVGILDRAVAHGDLERAFGKHDEEGYTSSNIGSRAVKSILDDYESVRIVVCGHVHKMGGKSRRIGGERISDWMDKGRFVINVATEGKSDPDLNIGQVALDSTGVVWNCTGELKKYDFHQEAVQELQNIPGIGKKTARKLVNIGVDSVEELANASLNRLKEKIPQTSRGWRTLLGRAKAREAGNPVFLNPPELPSSPRVYLDIETDLDQESLVWLVGVFHDQEEEMRYFFAETPDQEKKMLKEFLSFLEESSGTTLFHYSTTAFDERILKKRLRANNLSVLTEIEESVDVGLEVERSVALPTTSNELSAVAGQVGYEFSRPNMDGRDVASIYANCVENGEEVPDRVFQYNRDDVLAVKEIVEWMEKVSPDRKRSSKTTAGKKSQKSYEDASSEESSLKFERVVEKVEQIGEDKAVVLSGLRKTTIHELLSDMYRRFSPEEVAVRYSKEDDGTWKAVIYSD